MRTVLVIVAVVGLLLLGGAGFVFWQSTPLYAFQQAAVAYREHDVRKFHSYVDTDSLTISTLNDLLFEPVAKDPHLTEFQQVVAASALRLAEPPIRMAIKVQIDDLIGDERKVEGSPTVQAATDSNPPQPQSTAVTTAPDSVPVPAPDPVPGSSTAGTLNEVLNVAKKELKDEGTRLKEVAYSRMDAWMTEHPHSTMSKLWNAPRDARGETIKNLLSDAGFVPANFRGVSSKTLDGNTILAANFWSPRANREFAVEIELIDQSASMFSQKRISRIRNLKEIVKEIDPDYDQEVQGLIASSLSGVSERTVAREARDVVKRIGKDPATQKFLGRAKDFLEKMKEEQ